MTTWYSVRCNSAGDVDSTCALDTPRARWITSAWPLHTLPTVTGENLSLLHAKILSLRHDNVRHLRSALFLVLGRGVNSRVRHERALDEVTYVTDER